MYCETCGAKIDEQLSSCPFCGQRIIIKPSAVHSTGEKPQAVKPAINYSLKILLIIASVFLPIIGYISYFVLKKTDRKLANICGIVALVSSVLSLIILIINPSIMEI